MPSFLAWLFVRHSNKDNKVISSFSTFLRLLLSFFDIPRIISRFSEPLGALRIPSLVSELLLFSFLSLLQLFSISSLVLFSFSSHLISCSSLSHLTFPAYLSLLFHYPLIDSVQCYKPLFLISVVPAVQFVRRNPPFSGQVIDFELLVRAPLPSTGQISVGASAHLRRLPTAGNSVKLIDHVNGSAARLSP